MKKLFKGISYSWQFSNLDKYSGDDATKQGTVRTYVCVLQNYNKDTYIEVKGEWVSDSNNIIQFTFPGSSAQQHKATDQLENGIIMLTIHDSERTVIKQYKRFARMYTTKLSNLT